MGMIRECQVGIHTRSNCRNRSAEVQQAAELVLAL